MLHFDLVTCNYLNQGNERENIGYIINYVAPKKNKIAGCDWRNFLFIFCSLESPPSILVTRNLTGLQRSGTKTGCVKGRY